MSARNFSTLLCITLLLASGLVAAACWPNGGGSGGSGQTPQATAVATVAIGQTTVPITVVPPKATATPTPPTLWPPPTPIKNTPTPTPKPTLGGNPATIPVSTPTPTKTPTPTPTFTPTPTSTPTPTPTFTPTPTITPTPTPTFTATPTSTPTPAPTFTPTPTPTPGGGALVQVCIFKFHDLNGDGVHQSQNEPFLQGWTFTITQTAPPPAQTITTVTTGAQGLAGVCINLPAGATYAVTETPQQGWFPTTPTTQTIALVPNQGSVTLLFGNR